MARIRTIKPDFWDDEKLALGCCRDARLLYIALWNLSDDFGVVKGNPVWLCSNIFPFEIIHPKTFRNWLLELETLRRILAFDVNGERFYFISNFAKHQVINRPNDKMRNPAPPKDIEENHGTITDLSLNPPGVLNGGREGGREGKGKGKEGRKTFCSDSVELLLAEFFLQLLDERNYPWSKKGKPDPQKWATGFDLIIRIDGREPDEIREVLVWCQRNDFWQDNILSPKKLREQWEQLVLKMRKINGEGFKQANRIQCPSCLGSVVRGSSTCSKCGAKIV